MHEVGVGHLVHVKVHGRGGVVLQQPVLAVLDLGLGEGEVSDVVARRAIVDGGLVVEHREVLLGLLGRRGTETLVVLDLHAAHNTRGSASDGCSIMCPQQRVCCRSGRWDASVLHASADRLRCAGAAKPAKRY